jgi:hypothetical protein
MVSTTPLAMVARISPLVMKEFGPGSTDATRTGKPVRFSTTSISVFWQ